MSIEKIREEFEAWYLAEYFEGDKQFGLEWLSTEPCGGYRHCEPAKQWKIWQASRAAIEVDLGPDDPIDESGEYLHQDFVKSRIESLGLKVKP